MSTDYEALLARHDYAIIDCASIPDENKIDGLPSELLVPYEMRGDTALLPALLPLKAGAPYMKTLADAFDAADAGVGGYPLACLFEAPGVKPGGLKVHLTDRLMMHSPRGGKDFLRYYSPRIFLQLARILTPEQRRTLYGPIQVWTFHFQQQWHSWPAPEVTGIVPKFWSVKTEQRDQVARLSLVTKALADYTKQRDRPWRDIDEYYARTKEADQAIIIARDGYRLRDADDIAAFTVHALTYGEYFHQHPAIQARLREVKANGHTGYLFAVADLDAAAWAAIANTPSLTNPFSR